MIRAVVFDMDGVLIDSEPLHFSAIEAVLKKYGVTITPGYLDRFTGDTNERAWAAMKNEFDLKEPAHFYIKQQLESTVDCLWRDDYSPIEGVVELLGALKANGYPIGVASSSPPVMIENILKRIGIEEYIDKWVSGNDVQESKPAPYIYLAAAEKIGQRPEHCVAVEDSVYGVASAKSAGLKCIAYKSAHAVKQDLSAADITVNQMSQITLDMIKGL